MSVFREIILNYGDDQYRLVPSNRLLRRIDGELRKSNTTLINMMQEIGAGKPSISDVSFVVCEFLREGGAEFDEDDVYAFLMGDLANGGKGFAAVCEQIIAAISPQDMPEKKAQAPKKKGQKKKG